MRELEKNRQVGRREAARANGRHALNPSHQDIHAKFGAYTGDHFAMPEDTAAMESCQDDSGGFFFMAGFSRVGGPDAIAG